MTLNTDSLKRQRLRVLLKVMLLLAAFVCSYVLIAMFVSGEPDESTFETSELQIQSQTPGTMVLFNWHGRPVLILRRTPEQIESLHQQQELRDAESKRSQQPVFAQNMYRSRSPEWFIAIALGTDLNCAIEWFDASAVSAELASGSASGSTPGSTLGLSVGQFRDSCRGSSYDLAGRVFQGQNAEKNLPIPEYTLDPAGRLVLGAVEP